MGSKTPPSKPPSIDLEEATAIAQPSSSGHAMSTTSLQRIARALQVPLDALYQQPRFIDGTPQLDEEVADAADRAAQCAALVQAFMRIRDTTERNRIVALVKASADRT